MRLDLVIKEIRNPGPVYPLFPSRWSQRAFSGEQLNDHEIKQLFEAARWAPSAFNNQPWQFRYAKKGGEHWNSFFDPLVEFNQVWCQNASILIAVLSQRMFDRNDKPNQLHAFETGAAWDNLMLQASTMGLSAHTMSGFDYDVLKHNLKLPESHELQAVVAVGKPGNKNMLPKELQEREFPSIRKEQEEFVKEGLF